MAKVFHAELLGLRENKYDWLLKHDIKTTEWNELSPKSEFYLFIPREEKLLKEYEQYPKITDIFPVNSVGIVTARDDFVIDFNKETLKSRIMMFRNKNMPDEFIKKAFNLKDKLNWKLKNAREKIMKDEKCEESIIKILYRPFDARWIFNHDAVIERSRKEVMKHMLQENLALITIRRSRSSESWKYGFVTDKIISGATATTALDINYIYPLYLYPDINLFNHHAIEKREPNINPKLIETLCKNYKITITPEEIFYYIYAVLYSNIYRTKYAEFLKIDFPKIPFTKNYELFCKMAEYGKRLVDLHLLRSFHETTLHNAFIAKFQGKGDNKIVKIEYEILNVYINQTQYFEGIPKEVWEYQIGGYQVCEKWLKDRKNKELSLDDIKHYCKIITALQKTIEIQKMIDDIYLEVEDTNLFIKEILETGIKIV